MNNSSLSKNSKDFDLKIDLYEFLKSKKLKNKRNNHNFVGLDINSGVYDFNITEIDEFFESYQNAISNNIPICMAEHLSGNNSRYFPVIADIDIKLDMKKIKKKKNMNTRMMM